MKEKIVCVEWDDASFDSGYYDRTDPARYTELLTLSVGHVVKRDGKQILIGTDRWKNARNETEYRHITTIPLKMVRKITVLKGE